jgi:alpha-beta hydrolase superfamily lysophospholipase
MAALELVSVDGIVLDAAVEPAPSSPAGSVLLVHGLTVDMDEGGAYARLAADLADRGFATLRFSFRGHGRSGGTERGMTIAGEMLDLQAALEYAGAALPAPLAIVAGSFGAVPVCLSLRFVEPQLRSLVLLNPVLDLGRTFVAPETPWARRSFADAGRAALRARGFLRIDDGFQVGRVLYEEMCQLDPYTAFLESTLPTLIVHGDRDTYVPYDVARAAAAARPNTELRTIAGADHGFAAPDEEREALEATLAWLAGGDGP